MGFMVENHSTESKAGQKSANNAHLDEAQLRHLEEKMHQNAAKVAVADFVAGSLGGLACKTVEFPFDTVKVLLQTQKGQEYRGSIDVFRSVIRHHGVKGLYFGVASPLIGSMAENATLFAAYGLFKRMFLHVAPADMTTERREEWSHSVPANILAGFGAGIFVSFILTPVELIKVKLQVQSSPGSPKLYTGAFDCFFKLLKQGGVRGLYQGHLATTARELPGNAAWFATYEFVKKQFIPVGGTRDDVPSAGLLLAGAFAGMAYWTANFPFDTVKSLIQVQHRHERSSIMQVVAKLFREKGIRGFYQGWLITTAKAFPSNALLFLVYEKTAEFLTT